MHWHTSGDAQGGGGVTISGGVQEPWTHGTESCGQWAWWDGLGLGFLEVFSDLHDSTVLWFYARGVEKAKCSISPGS